MISSKAKSGLCALTLAVKKGDAPSIASLLCPLAEEVRRQCVAASREEKHPGMTAVHLAAIGGHADALRVLLELKADPTLKNKTGQSPLAVVSKANNTAGVIECREILQRIWDELSIEVCMSPATIAPPGSRLMQCSMCVCVCLQAERKAAELERELIELDEASAGAGGGKKKAKQKKKKAAAKAEQSPARVAEGEGSTDGALTTNEAAMVKLGADIRPAALTDGAKESVDRSGEGGMPLQGAGSGAGEGEWEVAGKKAPKAPKSSKQTEKEPPQQGKKKSTKRETAKREQRHEARQALEPTQSVDASPPSAQAPTREVSSGSNSWSSLVSGPKQAVPIPCPVPVAGRHPPRSVKAGTPPLAPVSSGSPSYAEALQVVPPLEDLGGVSKEDLSRQLQALSAENDDLKATLRQQEQAMLELHPCLDALSIETANLLGVGIQDLSISQIEGLEAVLDVMKTKCKDAKAAVAVRAQQGDGPGFLVHDVPDMI